MVIARTLFKVDVGILSLLLLLKNSLKMTWILNCCPVFLLRSLAEHNIRATLRKQSLEKLLIIEDADCQCGPWTRIAFKSLYSYKTRGALLQELGKHNAKD